MGETKISIATDIVKEICENGSLDTNYSTNYKCSGNKDNLITSFITSELLQYSLYGNKGETNISVSEGRARVKRRREFHIVTEKVRGSG